MCTCTSLTWGEEEVTTTLATGEEEPVTGMTTWNIGEEEGLPGGVSLASTRARGEETPDLPCCCGDSTGPFGAF